MLSPFFGWMETTSVAVTVRDSLLLTAGLSAVHVLGFTLVTGSALVANLTLLGALFRGRPIVEVTAPAARGVALGLAISIATGMLLFAPRATPASGNGIFQLKMLLLVSATAFHFTVHRAVTRRTAAVWIRQATGAVGLALWLGLALAGAAFILLE